MDLRNPADCVQLLKRLRPVDISETQAILLEMLATLRTSEAAPLERLHVLESARDILHRVQDLAAQRYANQPLAPDSTDNPLFLHTVRLWQASASTYGQLSELAPRPDTHDGFQALAAQRRVQYAGCAILEYFRAHRMLAVGLWAALHEAYLSAEMQGVARQRVADPMNVVWTAQSPSEAYVAILLVDLANPYGRSPQELTWVSRWAQRFAPYCGMHVGSDESASNSYGLDLSSDHGLRPLNMLTTSPTLRRFDGSRVAGQIQIALTRFKNGVTPAALGLGEDCPAEAGGRLLLWLYRPWGLGSAGRKFPRRPSRGKTQITIPREATVFFVNRGQYHQPGAVNEKIHSLKSDMQLLTFGERVDDRPDGSSINEQAEMQGLQADVWDVLDQSVGGFRLRGKPRKNRLSYHQLVGLRPPEGEDFMLAHVSWLMFWDDGLMEAGFQMLPGIPTVVGVRPLVTGESNGDFLATFMLPEIASLKQEQSVVLPSGWYRPGRILQMHDSSSYQEIQLGESLLQGSNFEQAAFKRLPKRP